MLLMGSGIREEVATAVKKAPAAAVTAMEGIGAVVLEAATVAMASADNSGNGGAGNGGRNRGSSGATPSNQNVAAVEAKTVVMAAAMDVGTLVVAAVEAAAAAAAATAVKW